MKANRLINASSPYLLQHAYNPVDWHEWNDETLQKAKDENKPIIVSIGYSACHWCHVMERECFENETLAQIMNQHFINIKVDREERPDIDQIYMDAVQNMGLRGGWPLNVFLTADAKPFYGGTYFPSANWQQILNQVANAYENHFEEIYKSAQGFTDSLNRNELLKFGIQSTDNEIDISIIQKSIETIKKQFDPEWGGLDKEPKFPMPCIYNFLLKAWKLTGDEAILNHTIFTLKKIALGGIYDHLGGGFMRYSTDKMWFAPHFEKMLYDNAQLLGLYAEAFQITQDSHFKNIIYQTIDFIEREMSNEEGGFYSAYDADSEGEEGKFYVWKYQEIIDLGIENIELFLEYFNITPEGNWEHGNNILIADVDLNTFSKLKNLDFDYVKQTIESITKQLFDIRNKKTKPGLDDKILTSWNALTCSGLLKCYFALGEPKFRELAIKNFNFLAKNQLKSDFTLFHNYKNGKSTINGFLEDYSAFIDCTLKLYEATFDEKYLELSKNMALKVVEQFADSEDEFLFFTSKNDQALIARKKEIFDNVIPASNSMMLTNFYLLGHYLDIDDFKIAAQNCIEKLVPLFIKEPAYLSNWGSLMALHIAKIKEVVVVGPKFEKLSNDLQKDYLPFKITLATGKNSNIPLFEGRDWNGGETQIYICENKTCDLPTDNVETAKARLKNPIF